ncbi:MAG: metal ABC transporter ATP-binding protein [Deltaproteobacteria bacterium]|nr:metal ABC transporter ATP-binding protein [Deltaproteobacteria bacterium]
MTDQPVIEVRNVSFTYDGFPVLDRVDLTVMEYDFLSIVGPNAGGKTTLLKLILGLLKPSRGTVKVFGQIPEKARHRIGYMPQHTALDPLFPVSVLDVVLMGRLGMRGGMGFFKKGDREAAMKALREVEMDQLTKRSFAALSGGQRQRVLIARALVSSPDILLLDEPTSNIDIAVETELFDMLSHMNRKITIVLVTHDIGFVSQYVKHVACVNRKVVVHPTSEISGEMINEIYGTDVRMVRHDSDTMKRICDV